MMHEVLQAALVVLLAAVGVLLASHKLRLPPVVGLLVAGTAIGPSGLGLLAEVEAVEVFAEIGVVFLLFSIGLEFSLERLRDVRRPFLVAGPIQALATVAAVAVIGLCVGQPVPRAIFFGFLVALSSTAVVLDLYAKRQELETPHGKLVLAVLLFQDFLVVPMIVLVPVLAGRADASPLAIAARFAGGVLAVGAVFLAARYLMPRLLHRLVRTRIRELLVLAALAICLGAAYLTEWMGFSLALGAFLAGIIVAESPYSPQVVAEVAPFRDVFASVFFISIGMLLDLRETARELPLVVAVAALVIVLKTVTGAVATRAMRLPARTVGTVALALAQVGEFSFVLLTLGRTQGLVDERTYQVIIAVAVLTLLATPGWIAAAPRLGPRLPRWLGVGDSTAAAGKKALSGHVVVVGYGLAGRTLARVLREAGIPYVVIELSGDAIEQGRRDGEPMVFGDASRPDVLAHANLAAAQVVVFAISDLVALRRSIAIARQQSPGVHLIVRTRALAQLEDLRRAGADEVVAEELETAIEIFTRVLERYHVPRNVIRAQTRLLRGEEYRMLRAPSLRGPVSDAVLAALAAGTTELYRVETGSRADGRALDELDLRRKSGATVIAVVRDGRHVPNPQPDVRLRSGDTLVLVGSHREIESAFELLEAPGDDPPPLQQSEAS